VEEQIISSKLYTKARNPDPADETAAMESASKLDAGALGAIVFLKPVRVIPVQEDLPPF
jgi:hypothetical protein